MPKKVRRVPFKQYVLRAGRTQPLPPGLEEADRDVCNHIFQSMPNDLLLKIAPLMETDQEKALEMLAEHCSEHPELLNEMRIRNQERGHSNRRY